MAEDLSKSIRKRREAILRLVEEAGRVREQEPGRAGQIDTEVELGFEAIQEEIRSLRNQLIPIREETMNEEQGGSVQHAIQSPSEVSEEEKKRIAEEERKKEKVMEARKEEIGHLEKKIGNIRKTLEKRPGDKFLTTRLGELEDRQTELQKLNDNGIVTARTPNRRSDSSRSRYFGLV